MSKVLSKILKSTEDLAAPLRLMAHTQDVTTSMVLLKSAVGDFELRYDTWIGSLTSTQRKSPRELHRLPGHLHLTVGIAGGILCWSMSTTLVKVQVERPPTPKDCGCGAQTPVAALKDADCEFTTNVNVTVKCRSIAKDTKRCMSQVRVFRFRGLADLRSAFTNVNCLDCCNAFLV